MNVLRCRTAENVVQWAIQDTAEMAELRHG